MPEARRRLGRGLDALLPSLEENPGDRVELIPCAHVAPNPEQPRRQFEPKALEELAASIRVHGVLQPVIVRRVDSERYQLVAGERRLRAAAMAGLDEIPAIVREFSDAELAEVALVENLQREDLNAMEEAQALQRLLSEFGLTQEELARRLGRSRPAVANSLRLLHAAPGVRGAVAEGQLSAGHARALLAVDDVGGQEALAGQVIRSGLSVRETERIVQKHAQAGRARPETAPRARTPEWRDAEERLRNALGTRVRIQGTAKKGTVEIDFYGLGDLERLIELLGGG